MNNQVSKYRIELEKKISQLERDLVAAPEGFLICAHDRGYTKWYNRLSKEERLYIPKSQVSFARELARKKYANEILSTLKKELELIKTLEELVKKKDEIDFKYLGKGSAYRELLNDRYTNLDEELKAWMAEDYVRSNKYSENLRRSTDLKTAYRSKSEMIIEMALSNAGIPFRYECELIINGIAFYPDFTIKRPSNGEIVYWEHFGMMDDPQYLALFHKKIDEYASAGILPGDKLILTFETANEPLSIDTVNETVKHLW